MGEILILFGMMILWLGRRRLVVLDVRLDESARKLVLVVGRRVEVSSGRCSAVDLRGIVSLFNAQNTQKIFPTITSISGSSKRSD